MGITVVARPGRRSGPALPSGELLLAAPPQLPTPKGRSWQQLLTALPMLAMMAAMMLMFSGSMAGGLRLVVFALFGVAMLGMLAAGVLGGGAGRPEMAQARRGYLRGLAQHRVRFRRGVAGQREAMAYLHPDPAALWSLTATSRLWERRPEDADFAVVRIGTGPQSPALELVAPDTAPLEQLEPLSALALRRFLTTHRAVPDLPLAVPLTGFARLHLDGDPARVRALTRALLAQLATLHAPEDVRIAVCADPARLAGWEWLKWLPHALHPDRVDAAGPMRLAAPTLAGLEAMLDDLLRDRPRFDPDGRRGAGPQLVVVLDGGATAGAEHLTGSVEGVTVLDLDSRAPVDRAALTLTVTAEGVLHAAGFDGAAELGRADALEPAPAEALARTLAPLRLRGELRGESALRADLGLAELLELGDPYAFDPATTWTPRANRDRLRATFGLDADGAPIELDLKESAQDGMGPHGLLIGATGSGKSELLRTLVLSLAVTHAPSALNFVLVDFKGGATFARLDRLPHTSALITNLADQLPLVDRMTDALNGELIRRQELLRSAGDFDSLRDYDRARAAGAPLPEVPTLMVVCDEFSELLSAKPEFIDTFVQIGRVGRSLGVHLLLASQRLEEGRLRGLDAHLSYRVGLRTFSATDSHTVLGVADAHQLPRAPGHGLLRFGTDPLTRFRAAYVSGVHRRAAPGVARSSQPALALVEYGCAYVAPLASAPVSGTGSESGDAEEEAVGESLLDILVARMAGRGTPAHPVWLPPLGAAPSLDAVLGDRAQAGRLRISVGLVDRPYEQRRDPLSLDLAGGAGHLLITGAPRTGKSTALRTVVTALAMTHTPAQVQVYCLDFGGGSLAGLRGLPHVGGVAGRQDAGAVRRTVAQIAAVLSERERRFAAHGIADVEAYRAARARGEFADDPHGDVFLVIDGWPTLRAEFEEAEQSVCDLVARGLAYGVHVLTTCPRSLDLRPAVRDAFGSRIELRLGDPIESAVSREAAARVPDSPGRGLAASGHHLQLALPRAGAGEPADLVAAIGAGWAGRAAPAVRLLPGVLPYEELTPPVATCGLRVEIGIAEEDLRPVALDFAADPHLLLLGDAQSGKTAFLRALARRICQTHTPEQARILVIDHRRGLLGEVPDSHLLGHGGDPASTARLAAEVARAMVERMPGPDVTPAQLRARNWWRGPELFVLVDDADLVAPGLENPLAPLLEYLPQSREVGLHVVLTRRTGGAGRAMFTPLLARLRDVGSPGLLLSGSKDEGPLLGGLTAGPLPPGRGRLIERGNSPRLVQLAWSPPTD